MNFASNPSLMSSRSNRDENATFSSFLNSVRASYENGIQTTTGEENYYFKIGGFLIRLHFVSNSLVPKVVPAIEHLLTVNESIPDLTIHLWDSKTTGNDFPDIKKEYSGLSQRGNSWVGSTKTHNFFFQPEIGILNILDRENANAFFWARNASKIPYYESGAPLRMIFHWWMGKHGKQFLHAGAVGTEKGGVLLVGKGGSGKSTTAFASLNAGMLYAADDYCMVTKHATPYIHSLYSSGKLNAEDISEFPNFTVALANPDKLETEKALYFFNKIFPKRIANGFPLKAILIPEIGIHQKTKLEKVSPATSFLAIAPSTIFQLQDKKQKSHLHIGELVRKVPNYKLLLGTDKNNIPEIIKNLITNLSS